MARVVVVRLQPEPAPDPYGEDRPAVLVPLEFLREHGLRDGQVVLLSAGLERWHVFLTADLEVPRDPERFSVTSPVARHLPGGAVVVDVTPSEPPAADELQLGAPVLAKSTLPAAGHHRHLLEDLEGDLDERIRRSRRLVHEGSGFEVEHACLDGSAALYRRVARVVPGLVARMAPSTRVTAVPRAPSDVAVVPWDP